MAGVFTAAFPGSNHAQQIGQSNGPITNNFYSSGNGYDNNDIKNQLHKSPAKKNFHWRVPRSVNPHFTGQKEILTTLCEQLCNTEIEEQKRFIIYGMGGSGKSELCLKFAEENRESFWAIFWVDATDDGSIKQGIIDSAKAVRKEEMSYEDGKLWFSNLDKSWLLILDNADNINIDYSEFFPSGNYGTILLTTRNKECDIYNTVGSYESGKLASDDAVTLLLISAGIKKELWPDKWENAKNLIGDEVLAQHALSITQAGAFIRQGLCKLENYGEMFEKQRKKLLEYRPKQAKSIYGDVYSTFEISAGAMENSTKQECLDGLKLLEVLAFLHREGVPEELFTKAWNHALQVKKEKENNDIGQLSLWHINHLESVLHEGTTPAELDLVRLRQARRVLESFSLIKIHPETQDISIHPLVHAWAKDRLLLDSQIRAWATTASILTLSIETLDYQEFYNKIETHVKSCLHLQQEDVYVIAQYPPLEIDRTFYRLAWMLYYNTNSDLAKKLANRLMSRVGLEIPPRSWNWRWLVYLLASCKSGTESPEGVILLLEDVLAFDEENNLPPTDPNHLSAREALGREYARMGQQQQAIGILEDVVRIQQETLALTHPHLLSSQHELTCAYIDYGQPDKAIKLLYKVVQISQNTLALTHPSLLASRYELARAYSQIGQLEKAIELLHEVVQINQKTLALTHPRLLASQHELGRAYLEIGQLEKAIELLHEVVEIRQKTLALTHPDLLTSQHNLAVSYYRCGKYQEALSIAQRVVEVRGTLQPDNRDRQLSEGLLAICVSALKQENANNSGIAESDEK
ncbi:hypothetical protein B7463_g1450, partial [Scytalidium lignicola]